MYLAIYKDVILFKTNTKQEAINAIMAYAEKCGKTFDSQHKIFGRTNLLFYDVNGYYNYVIIKE